MPGSIPVSAVQVNEIGEIRESTPLYRKLPSELKEEIQKNIPAQKNAFVYNDEVYALNYGEKGDDGTKWVVIQKSSDAITHSMAALLQSMEDIVLELSLDGVFINAWTRDEERLFMPRHLFLGKKVVDVFPSELAAPIMTAFNKVVTDCETETIRYGSPNPEDDSRFEARISCVLEGGSVRSVAVLIRDITVEVKGQYELKQALDRLNVITSIPGAPVIYSAEPYVPKERFISSNAVHLTGYEVVNSKSTVEWEDLVHPEDLNRVTEEILAFLKSDEVRLELEYRIVHKLGHTVWVGENLMKSFDENGKNIAVHGVLIDISNLKSVLNELKVRETLLARAGRIGKMGAWQHNRVTNEMIWSEEIYSIFGLEPRSDMSPSIGFDYFVEPEKKIIIEKYTDLIENGVPYDVTGKFTDPVRGERWIRTVGLPLYEENGGFSLVYGFLQDLTEQKRKEVALEESMQMFDSAFSNAPLGIGIIALDGSWQQVNQAMCKMFGYTEEEMLGIKFAEMTHPEEVQLDTILVQDVIDGKLDHIAREKRYVRKDGTAFWGHVHASPVRDAEGNVKYFISQLEETTERRKYEEQILKSSELARKAANAKSDFLAQMSHEIRTPMNAVVGITNLLYQEAAENPELFEKVNILKFSAENLLSIVNDILDLSKIEQGSLRIERMSVKIRDIVQGVRGMYQQRAEENATELIVNIDSQVPDGLKGDPQRITQVLNNLVSNSIKYTKDGVVEIRVTGETIEDQFELNICVSDTGVGIDDKLKEIIFEPFTQGDSDFAKMVGGTGLGLTISNRLTQLMGGELTFDSVVGKGTDFTLKLSLDITASTPVKTDSTSMSADSLKGVKMLLVEDNKMNVFVAERFLRNWGVDLTIATSGEAALEMPDLFDYQVILMDMHMPGMNGLQTIEEMRKKGVKSEVLMLTAAIDVKEREDDWDRLKIRDIVFKPFVPEDLLNKIQSAVASSILVK